MPELPPNQANPESKNVNADFVRKHGVAAIITHPGGQTPFAEGNQVVYKQYIFVTFNDGITKQYTPNKLSIENLKKNWGTNTDNWVNKPISFEIRQVKFKGDFVDSIIAHPIIPAEPKQEREQG